MHVELTTRQGSLRGKVVLSARGQTYFSFQGIPYAKPPLGELRFKPPQPCDPWTGIRDATREGNMAPQFSLLANKYLGDEDCLYLNVYTPKLPTKSRSDMLPVMVWIHGGGYSRGSGNTDAYGPDYLLQHGVLLVTFNYRLGALGFMTTGDSVVPGNMGLKDMVMALRWVRENIANFGGDPHNVTIFGESAGSRACHLMMLSPMAKGLFQRVVCQSTVSTSGSLRAPVAERTRRLALHLGLPEGASGRELVAFLRDVPARMLVEQAPYARSKEETILQDAFPFWPTVEPEDAEGGAFITQDPEDIMASGDYNAVPAIIGVNSQEGYIYLKDLLGDVASIRDLDNNFHLLVPKTVAPTEEQRSAVARLIRSFYFANKRLDASTLRQYTQVRGDATYIYQCYRAARRQAETFPAQPVYFYFFNVDTRLNWFKRLYGAQDFPGASHADDIGYLFRVNSFASHVGPDSVEGRIIARMTKLWTNFAKTGNPTPVQGDPLLSVTWPAVSTRDPSHLYISNHGLSIEKNLLKPRMDFWDGLYNKKNGLISRL
ncbi:juvenile hormone esterase-like [Schistocerca nitens]|uniref:juvenile hormone esterase-like n=1 Tax=Schistocerca nitens TaxID=7011 RepID=UPI00211945A8|nr:juvenile hormone esterase-like [Schistocerca nitens]